jgi:hypothetical protein
MISKLLVLGVLLASSTAYGATSQSAVRNVFKRTDSKGTTTSADQSGQTGQTAWANDEKAYWVVDEPKEDVPHPVADVDAKTQDREPRNSWAYDSGKKPEQSKPEGEEAKPDAGESVSGADSQTQGQEFQPEEEYLPEGQVPPPPAPGKGKGPSDFGEIFDNAGKAFDEAGKAFDQAGKAFGKAPEPIPFPPGVIEALTHLSEGQAEVKEYLKEISSKFEDFTSELREDLEAHQASQDELLDSVKAELEDQSDDVSDEVSEQVSDFIDDVQKDQEANQEELNDDLQDFKTEVTAQIDELTAASKEANGEDEQKEVSFIQTKLFKLS